MTKLGGSLLSYVAHEFRPRFCLAKVKELFGRVANGLTSASRWASAVSTIIMMRSLHYGSSVFDTIQEQPTPSVL